METLLEKIQIIKLQLADIRGMRPGSLSRQLRKSGQGTKAYWQISYTYKRSKTEYVREEFVRQIQAEIAEYKKFKLLTNKWVALGIQLSKEKQKVKKIEPEMEKS